MRLEALTQHRPLAKLAEARTLAPTLKIPRGSMKRVAAHLGRMTLCINIRIVTFQQFALSQQGGRDSRPRYQVLYVFRGGADGDVPGTLVLDGASNLYGTTSGGGASGHGTVFKPDPTGKHTDLYSFKDGRDGDIPNTNALVRDSAGNLYGTTT